MIASVRSVGSSRWFESLVRSINRRTALSARFSYVEERLQKFFLEKMGELGSRSRLSNLQG
jgi:hypothetical protein